MNSVRAANRRPRRVSRPRPVQQQQQERNNAAAAAAGDRGKPSSGPALRGDRQEKPRLLHPWLPLRPRFVWLGLCPGSGGGGGSAPSRAGEGGADRPRPLGTGHPPRAPAPSPGTASGRAALSPREHRSLPAGSGGPGPKGRGGRAPGGLRGGGRRWCRPTLGGTFAEMVSGGGGPGSGRGSAGPGPLRRACCAVRAPAPAPAGGPRPIGH